MRALVVEDDPGIANFVKKGLMEASWAVEIAGNGDDGLRLGCSEPYDVMILDIMLPGRDGFGVRAPPPVDWLHPGALKNRRKRAEKVCTEFVPSLYTLTSRLGVGWLRLAL